MKKNTILIRYEKTDLNAALVLKLCHALEDNFGIIPQLEAKTTQEFSIWLDGIPIFLANAQDELPTPGYVIDTVAKKIEGKARDFVVISESTGAFPVIESCACAGGAPEGTTCCVVTKYDGPR